MILVEEVGGRKIPQEHQIKIISTKSETRGSDTL